MAGEQDEQQTWKEWIPPDNYPDETYLLTRKEVIARAQDLNVRRPGDDDRKVDERVMRHWEGLGIIPRGQASESGHHQNLYPWWVVDMLHQVCRYREAGVDLGQLPAIMRQEALRLSHDPWPRQKQRREPTPDEDDFWLSVFDPEQQERLREPTQPPFPRPPDAVYDRAVERLIGLLNTLRPDTSSSPRRSASIPARVRVSYVDEQGQTVRAYDVALDDPDAADDFIGQDKHAFLTDIRRGFYQTPAKE